MSEIEETNETTIELYEKNEFAAGEPCILVTGDPSQRTSEDEDITLVIATPTEIAQQMTPANGMVGLLTTEKIPLGAAWFTGTEISNAEASISAHTGYIDATLYQGEVEGVETAMTLTITGLNWPEGPEGPATDVNKDGSVNVTDVVSVYNYTIIGTESGISKADADVNGDGDVNVTDVVEIYNYIINGDGGAKSPAFGTVVAEGQDPVVYALVENTDDLTNIPVNIYLSNPDIDITAVEACIALPTPLTVENWVLDEDDEVAYETTERLTKSHGATVNAGSAEHGADYLFVSIASSKTTNIKETAGSVITVYFDGSNLANGSYELDFKDAIAVWSDKASSIQYNSPNAKVQFTINDGKATAVESATAETIANAKAIYTLDGKVVAAPQKGQIYVIDGQAVKY